MCSRGSDNVKESKRIRSLSESTCGGELLSRSQQQFLQLHTLDLLFTSGAKLIIETMFSAVDFDKKLTSTQTVWSSCVGGYLVNVFSYVEPLYSLVSEPFLALKWPFLRRFLSQLVYRKLCHPQAYRLPNESCCEICLTFKHSCPKMHQSVM